MARSYIKATGKYIDLKTCRQSLLTLVKIGAARRIERKGKRPLYEIRKENVLCLPEGLVLLRSGKTALLSSLLCTVRDRCPLPPEKREALHEHWRECPVVKAYLRSIEEFLRK